jgi:hypothetical protein
MRRFILTSYLNIKISTSYFGTVPYLDGGVADYGGGDCVSDIGGVDSATFRSIPMKPEEAKLAAEAFRPMGAIEAVIEGVRAIAPGLNLKDVFSDIGETLKQKLVQGQAEIGSVLYTSQGYVPYGQGQWAGRDKDGRQQDGQTHEISNEQLRLPEQGRSM